MKYIRCKYCKAKVSKANRIDSLRVRFYPFLEYIWFCWRCNKTLWKEK